MFMNFDVVEFYLSISKQLLISSIEIAKKNIDVSNNEIEIVLGFCKTILFFNDEYWIKKDLFDVPMGSYHRL